jgi:predicted dehydrogenase
MAESVKLCMIGAGQHAGWNMYPHFYFLKGGQIVANCDLRVDRARELAAKTGVERTYSDYHEMLDKEKPQGVIVCINSTMHVKLAIELLEKGYHVYTEKPNSNSLAECRQVRAAAHKAGKICMVAYKKRFAPAYIKTREIVRSEAFGKPVLLNLLRTRGNVNPDPDPNQAYMLQWGCHAIDLLTFIYGEIRTVNAFTTGPSPWAYACSLRFANDAVGSFTVTERVKGRNAEELTAIGSNGIVIKTDNSIEMLAINNNVPFAHHKPDFVNGAGQSAIEQGYSGELQAFIDAIATGKPPEANIDQATHTMAVYEAIQKSAAQGGALVEVEAI